MQATKTDVVGLEAAAWQSIRQDDLRVSHVILVFRFRAGRRLVGSCYHLDGATWCIYSLKGFGAHPVKDINTLSARRRARGSDGGLLQESNIPLP